MNKHLVYFLTILVFSLSSTVITSCSKPTEDVTVARSLVGIWRFSTSTLTVTVEGEDFVDYAMTNFGLTETEAQAMEDEIVDGNVQKPAYQIIFTNDKAFVVDPNSQNKQYGTWSVSADGEYLNLVRNNEEEEFQILEIDAKNLILQFPTNQVEVDVDGDGTNETIVDIDVEQNLTEVSNGGYGG
jgi:hypothetical protein